MQQALEHYRLHEDLTWEEFWSTFGPINFNYWMKRVQNNHDIRQVLEHSFTDTFLRLKREFNQFREISETYWGYFAVPTIWSLMPTIFWSICMVTLR